MSAPNFGEFFHALFACAIEQCPKEEPQAFRQQLGQLLYFTLGHAHSDWLIQLRTINLKKHGQNLLITQLLQQIMESLLQLWIMLDLTM